MSQTIAIVVTSHEDMGDTGKPTGVWIEELAVPYYVFKEAGYDVVLVSPAGGEVPIDPLSLDEENFKPDGQRYMADEEAKALLKDSISVDDFDPSSALGAFFAGGHGTMWDFTEPNVTALVETYFNANKPVASVCHGVVALVPARDTNGEPIVRGKKVTCFTDSEEHTVELQDVVPFLLETHLRELGGIFSGAGDFEKHVVQDGNLISGQNPASAKESAERVIAFIEQKAAA